MSDSAIDGVTIQQHIDRDEAEFTFPWMMYIVDKVRKDELSGKKKKSIFEKIDNDYDRAVMFFQYVNEKDARDNLITHEIQEYLDLSFFWDKFGLKPWEVESCDANWVQDMIMVSNAEGSVRSDRINEQNAGRKSSGGSRPSGGG